VAHETSRSSVCVAYLCVADCRVPRALAGAIEAKGISQRLSPRPTTKIARDWSSGALLVIAKLEIFVAIYSLESVLHYKGGIQLRPNSAFSYC
jgi:hypothetical protein